MSPAQAPPEVLVTGTCLTCGTVKPHLSQNEALAFRETHRLHSVHLAAEEEPAPASLGFDPVAAASQLNMVAERLGAQAEGARRQLRSVQVTDEEESARVQSQSPDELRVN